jgi:hypothetical protein
MQEKKSWLYCIQPSRTISEGGHLLATISSRILVCPAKSVPVEMRQTGMEGARNGEGEEV